MRIPLMIKQSFCAKDEMILLSAAEDAEISHVAIVVSRLFE